MTFEHFQAGMTGGAPPEGSNIYLQSLWYDGKGNWDEAHNLIQDLTDKTAAWIHAYLHRREGDVWNANYWYSKAGKRMPGYSLEQEWEELVKEML